jgi:hypothetical protein
MKTDGRCYKCNQRLEIKGWDAEHPQALELLGPDDIEALMPICKPCHKVKTADDIGKVAKARSARDKHIGAKRPRNPLPGSKASPWRKRMDGTVERRER